MIEKGDRRGRAVSIISQTIAKFLLEEMSGDSLITITRVELNKSGHTAHVFCSVFPDDKVDIIFNLLKRSENNCKQYLKDKSNLRNVPIIRFEIDMGEHHKNIIENLIKSK